MSESSVTICRGANPSDPGWFLVVPSSHAKSCVELTLDDDDGQPIWLGPKDWSYTRVQLDPLRRGAADGSAHLALPDHIVDYADRNISIRLNGNSAVLERTLRFSMRGNERRLFGTEPIESEDPSSDATSEDPPDPVPRWNLLAILVGVALLIGLLGTIAIWPDEVPEVTSAGPPSYLVFAAEVSVEASEAERRELLDRHDGEALKGDCGLAVLWSGKEAILCGLYPGLAPKPGDPGTILPTSEVVGLSFLDPKGEWIVGSAKIMPSEDSTGIRVMSPTSGGATIETQIVITDGQQKSVASPRDFILWLASLSEDAEIYFDAVGGATPMSVRAFTDAALWRMSR